ncbi:MAG: hypothetical protein JW830_15220 [Bacteroidales bacterium]|nr:hypothetical protein [Bacteroidales bacterium]
MKKSLLALFIAALAVPAFSQKLIDIYKGGTVKLVPDPAYAQDNNWDQVFKNYYDTIYNTLMGDRKSLKVMPDGSVIVNHTYRNYYTKFSPSGKFEKEFGIYKSNGQPFKEINAIEGILNGNTFFTGLDNMGNMVCFDFNGNYKKTLKLDYMSKQMIPLPNNKIAVVGWVIWSTKFRDFVSIVDYETNIEKVIWEHFTPYEIASQKTGTRKPFNYVYELKKGGKIGSTTIPYGPPPAPSNPPSIACIGNKLIVAIHATGEILVYDLEGKLISKEKVGWERSCLSVQEQKEIQQKAIDRFKNKQENILEIRDEEYEAAMEYFVKEMTADLEKITEPMPMPFASSVIKDSDGNLLFFEFAKEENANKFNVWVYENGGKFVCQSSFVCDDYNLVINPSKMVYHNGYIYSLQLLKNAKGVPLRLVRFKLGN